jgi:hypothetical protein
MKKIFLIFLLLFSCEKGGKPVDFSTKQPTPVKIDVLIDGIKRFEIDEEFIKRFPEVEEKKGLKDIQRGVLLFQIFDELGIKEGKTVKFYSYGSRRDFSWQELEKNRNSLILALTHRGTFKLIGQRGSFLKRKDWVRHIYRIDIETR